MIVSSIDWKKTKNKIDHPKICHTILKFLIEAPHMEKSLYFALICQEYYLFFTL